MNNKEQIFTEDAIKVPKRVMKILGHWPEKSSSYIVKLSGIASWLIAISFLTTLYMELAKHFDDYDLLSAQLSITMPQTSFFIKLMLCTGARKCFVTLLQRLDLHHFNKYPKSCEEIVTKAISFSSSIGNLYQGMTCFVIVLFSMAPLCTTGEMPVPFSYDVGSFKYFIYALQVFGLLNGALINSSIDVLAIDFMSIATAQIGVLNKKIIDCNRNDDSLEANEKKSKCAEKWKDCVRHHNAIISYIQNLESLFSSIFLVQYLSSGIVMCNIGFQIVHTTPVSMKFTNMVFFLLTMLCELGMYSWFGNEVIVSSGAIKDACYESDWINSDLEMQTTLILIVENSKRPLFLTAGKFCALSLASFSAVIKTSYSYFALLQTLYMKSQD